MLGYFLLREGVLLDVDVQSPILPVVLYFVIGYCASKLVMSVFALSVDCILQCYVADEEWLGVSAYW